MLGSAPVRDLLSLTQATRLLLLAVLHFVLGNPTDAASQYVDVLAPGSGLLIRYVAARRFTTTAEATTARATSVAVCQIGHASAG